MLLRWRCVAEVSIASNLKVPKLPWRKISCRRKLLNTTERHQNTLSTPPVTTRRPPSTTMPDITKRRHTTLTARGHVIHGRGHAEEAVKAHTEEHGKK